MISSIPGWCGPPKVTPQSTTIHLRLRSGPKPYAAMFMPISPTPPSGTKTSSS